MLEYMEQHSAVQLMGAPVGYVGHEGWQQFKDQVWLTFCTIALVFLLEFVVRALIKDGHQ